jgi:TolB-like protein
MAEFDQAIPLLAELTSNQTLPLEPYIEASEYLAVAYVSTDQDAKADKVFGNVLQKDNSYRPSEWWWPHKRLMRSYYKTVSEMKTLEIQQSPGIPTIAVIDFSNNSVDEAEKYDNLGGGLAKILIGDLSVIDDLKVVERERIQYLLDELKLTNETIGGRAIVDPSSAPRLGRLLGAHSFVFGSFIRLGKNFRIDVRLVKTETGEIFKTASVEGKPDKVFDLMKELTEKITKDLEVVLGKDDRKRLDAIGGAHDVPIEAIALYGDAMASANDEDFKVARVKLEQALEIAPDFENANDLLAMITPLTML